LLLIPFLLRSVSPGGVADALAGPEFLLEVRRAHKAYGIAIGVTKPPEEAPEVNLADPLRVLARAIARYGIAVAGMADDELATLAAMRKALRPIDDFREASGPAQRWWRWRG
jgi:hypothetical protein